MKTGLEDKSIETLKFCIRNLKSGILVVAGMTEEQRNFINGHDVPPIEAVQINHMLLETFYAEAFRRGIDPDEIGPDVSELHQAWLDNRA